MFYMNKSFIILSTSLDLEKDHALECMEKHLTLIK